MTSATGSPLAEALERHEMRRAGGLPTISVIVGPVGLAIRKAARWAEGRGWVVVDTPEPGAIVAAWLDHLARHRDLPTLAASWLAGQIVADSPDPAARLRGMTAHERRLILDGAPASVSGSDAGALAARLLDRPSDTAPSDPSGWLGHLLGALPDRVEPGTPRRVASALAEWLPAGRAPAVLLAPRPGGGADPGPWVEQAVRGLAMLAEAGPRLALLLATPRGPWDDFERCAPESRAKALARSGVIAIEAPDADAVAARLRRRGVEPAPELDRSIRRLAADGSSLDLVDTFAAAAGPARRGEETPPDQADRARSAAERFLFERLASLAETAGLFALNARPGFAFGPSPMEVDLLCPDLGIAIEVDGYYHLRDLDAYRRDRRKDLELQRRDYLVLRFLADDVVAQLEMVLDTILATVAWRRARGGSPPG